MTLKRYTMNTTYGMAGFTPSEDEHGEWVKWTDVRDAIQELQAKLDKPAPYPFLLLKPEKPKCGKPVVLDTKGLVSTYCIYDEGHKGPCK